MNEKVPVVYIMTNKRNGTLYTGVTTDIQRRVQEHKDAKIKSFTQKYGLHRLVFVETHDTIVGAIEREKQIKAGSRKSKISLIETDNPMWHDLAGLL